MRNFFKSISDWAPKFHERVVLCANTEMMDHFIDKYIPRLESDLNRIATNRLAEASISTPLTFKVVKASRKELHIIPSDPVLFRKLEWGEFNADGTLKTPPHSILKEYKAFIKV